MLATPRLERRQFLAALGALAASPALARAARWPKVQALLDRYVAEKKISGASAALTVGGAPLAYVNSGTLALDSSVAANEHTLWRIYSMTKPVTGTAAAMLIEDGKLRLDQPVADFFPAFANLQVAIDPARSLDARPAKAPMTVRHLLTHTSGLTYTVMGKGAVQKAYREKGLFGFYGQPPEAGDGAMPNSLSEFAERLATVPLIAEPGTAYNYSLSLDLLGAVIERASGMPFDAFLRARLFGPLDMRSTAFRVVDMNRLSTNYFITPKGVVPVDMPGRTVFGAYPKLAHGGAGLVSSARDYARFGTMQLGDGALGSVRVMKPETARLIRSNLLPAGVTAMGDGSGYGAGGRVVIPTTEGANDSVGSYGWGGAAGTSFWIDPRRRTMVTLMTQFMPQDGYPIRRELRDAILADLA
jgi:CubicO group peptidase (beta-lactamase class C family)